MGSAEHKSESTRILIDTAVIAEDREAIIPASGSIGS